MAKTMQITVSIKDENGNVITEKVSDRNVPYIEEIEKQGSGQHFQNIGGL